MVPLQIHSNSLKFLLCDTKFSIFGFFTIDNTFLVVVMFAHIQNHPNYIDQRIIFPQIIGAIFIYVTILLQFTFQPETFGESSSIID